MNKLFFGDNLAVLRENIETASVDLVYLDPPFNSQARYNVLFKSPREDIASAQVAAFVDFWSWGPESEGAYHEILTQIGGSVATLVKALREALGESDMMAYLVMMAVRLVELRRVLRPTGTIFLHCDPTASHYLKLLMDAIFGPTNFGNEIIWQRTNAKGLASTRFARNHDTILRYTQGSSWTWNPQYSEHDENYVQRFYRHVEPATGRRYTLDNLLNPNSDRPNLTYDFLGVTRVWRWTRERMQEAYDQGLVVQSRPGGVPRLKRYLDEQEGTPIGDVWTDIRPVQSQAQERTGYPTQKPLPLLARILEASSNRDDVVLDPFCGCGTTVHAAETVGRRWVGIDVSIHAVHVIEDRLARAFGPLIVPKAEGIPADYDAAARLAATLPFQFQWWANYLIGVHYLKEVKKGADRGIDGELFFPMGPGRPYGRLLTSVKGGKNVTPAMVREVRGVIEREKAELGLFICLDFPTLEMQREAVVAGFTQTPHGRMPRLQILSIADWFAGRRPVLPPREQLPYAAFSGPRPRGKPKLADPNAPELPLSYAGGKAGKDVVRHFNPTMVRPSALAG